ncbi:MAG: CBS domain-containing protein [Balneolaceae bacterium]
MRFEIFTIQNNKSIYDALIKINENKKDFLLVIDSQNRVIGTLTNGDIRRSLIKGQNVNDNISSTYNCNFIKIYNDENLDKIIEIFKNPRINFLPILDHNDVLMNIITKNSMHTFLSQGIRFNINYNFLSLNDNIFDYKVYNRPWGFYKIIFLNKYSQSKILNINPKSELSLQEHKKREEYWVVINGEGVITIGESKKKAEYGSFIYVPKGCKHKLVNTSEHTSLMIVEVQLGSYFGEDDIIRYEDIYNSNIK